MAGIYLHIPFCVQRCSYCDFYSSTSLELKDKFIKACGNEIKSRKDYLADSVADTIYFGGGTPSVLHPEDIDKLLNIIVKHIGVSKDTEISFEANPDDLNPAYLKELKRVGVNRLSIGIQSFRDSDLLKMKRRHNAKQAVKCLEDADKAGFNDLSIDLIYGLPDLSVDQWLFNLRQIEYFEVNHLSAYHLTIEKGTVFSRWLQEGKIKEAEDENSLQQFQLLQKYTREQGFDQYEISNFAKDEQYSKHNCKYWKAEKYIGLGPSAHSFNGEARHWNQSDLMNYLSDFKSDNKKSSSVIREEILSPFDKRNELIMTSLRTKWGISKGEWEERQHLQSWDDFVLEVRPFIAKGDMIQNDQCLRIEEKSWFRADGIIASLFRLEGL